LRRHNGGIFCAATPQSFASCPFNIFCFHKQYLLFKNNKFVQNVSYEIYRYDLFSGDGFTGKITEYIANGGYECEILLQQPK